MCKVNGINKQIRVRDIVCNKHINKMDEDRVVTIVRNKSPGGRRSLGCTRKRRCENSQPKEDEAEIKQASVAIKKEEKEGKVTKTSSCSSSNVFHNLLLTVLVNYGFIGEVICVSLRDFSITAYSKNSAIILSFPAVLSFFIVLNANFTSFLQTSIIFYPLLSAS